MTQGEVVPFGKHKGQPVEVLVADTDYREWLVGQSWFRDRYPVVYQTVINYAGEPTETPEHNQMQASFLDDGRCMTLARHLLEAHLLQSPDGEQSRILGRTFESGGWDVTFGVMVWYEARDPYSWEFKQKLCEDERRIRVECKPDLGDDFPAVLRQVKHYGGFGDTGCCVVVRRSRFESVTWDQVSEMFAASKITLVREAELD